MIIFHLFLSTIVLDVVLLFNHGQKREAIEIQQFQLPLKADSSSSAFTTAQQLRIYLDYSTSFNALSDVQFFKDNVITPAVNYWQTTLSPKNPSTSPILVNRDCISDFSYINNDPNQRACGTDCSPTTTCSNLVVPSTYLKKCYKQVSDTLSYSGTDGAGAPNTDIVILVTAVTCNGTMLASALSCFQETSLDRPVLGVLTLCTQKYNPRFNIQMNINTIKHELAHALGFASDKFAFYRDANGVPLTPRDAASQPSLGMNSVGGFQMFSDKVAKVVTRNRKSALVGSYTKQIYAFTLPTLLNEARTFYNCPTLDAVDLQDAPAGTVNSHFNKLLVNNELMSPTADAGEGLTSRFTLALLQDTGWYNVDFTKADNFTFGQGLGCNFVLNGCYDWFQNNPTNVSPFCNTIPNGYAMKCSSDRRYTYSCHLYKNIGLDTKYVYFNQLSQLPYGDTANQYAGDNSNNEYCPINFKDVYGLCTSDCNVVNNNLRNDSDYQAWNDYYGSDSKCFDTTATAWNINSPINTYQPVYYGAKCLQYKCDMNASVLYVYNSGQIVCQTTIQAQVNQVKYNYLSFSINCPTFASVCIQSSNTSGSGNGTTTRGSKAKSLKPYISLIIIMMLASRL